ncbi:MAG: ATP-binding protein [Pseudomonadota bacterium]
MSSNASQRPSLVRRMAGMLWLAAALAYLVMLVSMTAGASYLIERNLDQQARQLLPVFDDLSAQVLLSPESSARERISSYAARIPDIGMVRIYDRGGKTVVAQYRKAGAPEFAAMGADRTAILAVHGGAITHVERFLGVGHSIQAFAPVRQVVQSSDLLDFGSAPHNETSETSETVGFIEIGMDFAPSRSSVYFGALVTLAVLSLVLLAGMSAIIRHMRNALRPLLSLQDALARIAEGDFDASVGDGPADREVATIRDAIGTTIVALRAREAERNEAVRAKVLADEANLAKGTFLANMSHEIRTPMNGVIGMLELLLETELGANQREFACVAHSSAESLLSLINDILDFSKIEAGKLDFEAIPFDLPRELASIAAGQALAARDKGLALRIDYPEHLPRLLIGDPGRIGQVLVNLISNAIKFTACGQVLVDVQLAGQDPAGCRLRLSVRDTGIGLTDEQLHTIFDKFTQADASTTRRYGGTGLGLSICKLLVEMMGGTIGATSEPGKGSTFWFELNLARAAASGPQALCMPAAAPAGAALPLAGYRVLAVDDNPVNLQVVSHMLGRLGAEVDLAENGRIAVHMFLAKPYALILMDCQMPELDGYQAVAEIRHLEYSMMAAQGGSGQARMPIVALTAHALEGERDKCLAAGMDDFLTKPLRSAALRDKLVGWLAPQCAASLAPEPEDEAKGDGIDAMRQMFGAKYAILVQLFLDDTPPRLAALHAAVAARDADRIGEIAHTVAGSAGAIGAEVLSSQCRALEHCADKGQLDGVAARTAALCAEFDSISARLQAMFAAEG